MACFGGFLPYFWGQFAKKARHIGKNEDAIFWRVHGKDFWGFRLDQAPKNRSSSIPVSGRGPRAYPLGSPPPGRAAQCCEAFKAEVSFFRCPFWLFSFQGVPGISKAGCRDRRVFSDLLDTVLLDGCPGFFEHPLPYASGFGSLVLP